jgi:aspartate beta-hydroxylase
LNSPAAQPHDEAAIARALQASRAEAAAGRERESEQILVRVAEAAPRHPGVLNELGVRMMSRGRAAEAYQLFVQATTADPRHPALWSNLANSLKALGRRAEEMEALQRALTIEPRHLAALLQKGAYEEDVGDVRSAARTYQNALDCLTPGSEPPVHIREAVEHARHIVDTDRAQLVAALEVPLAALRERHGGRARRVDACLDILMHKRKPSRSEPLWMYFPELPAIEFFERADFPWLDALEAATDEIRGELMRVLAADRDGLQPYIDFPATMPLDQFRELNRSRKWSAYFLWNQSEAVAAHIARCPTSARLLDATPRPRIKGRGPTAFFSILEPQTRIPPHVGVTNTRLTVHLPLVVPPDCGFRVGATTREWVPGKAWVFDDTINHEAWNLSDTPRAILLFDTWNPFLSAAERDMIVAATEVYVDYYGLPAEAVQ